MKKFLLLLASLFLAIPTFAQQNVDEPNRMLVNSGGSMKGYVIDRVDSITFALVKGEIKAEIEIHDATCDTLTLSITRTNNCRGFKINVVPENIANMLPHDVAVIDWLNRLNSPTYYDDFVRGKLSGINLNPDSKYVVYTVGIDMFGVEDGICRAEFSTPAPVIVGNPTVTIDTLERTLRTFKIEVTPSEDVVDYYCVAGKEGTMQQQYEMFGPMFGFTNFEQMIKSWGVARRGIDTVEWTAMDPNTKYEIFIVCSDANGNLAPHQVFGISTLELGGPGKAAVEIALGDYKMTEWPDGEGGYQMMPSQFIKFTPNDQASCYRMGVYLATVYDTAKEAIWNDLRRDPPMPMANWFFFEEKETDFQINPSVEAVAISAAKNINGEWGDVTELRFTTPAQVDETTTSSFAGYLTPAALQARFKATQIKNEPGSGKVPHLRKTGLSLAH